MDEQGETETTPLRARLLGLAAQVEQASSDEEALEIMQGATGLSMTDPAADRAELDRRVREARTAAAGE